MKKYIKSILIVFLILISFSKTSNTIDIDVINKELFSSNALRNIRNIAVFIEFSDSDQYVDRHLDDEESVANANIVYNSEELFEMKIKDGTTKVPSFKRFYKEQSYGNLIIDTDIYPKVDGKVVSYKDSHPYAYYLASTSSNTLGYSNYDERSSRENELIDNALKGIKEELENTYSNGDILDSDNNGYIDAISFIIEIPNTGGIGYGDLLWSHMSTASNVSTELMGKKISSYNLIAATCYTDIAGLFSLNQGGYGTLLHEFGHTLGFSDLYTNYASLTAPVGFLDLMGNYPSSNPPGFLTYFISDYRNYNNWHDPLDVITSTMKDITLERPRYNDPSEKRAVIIKGGSKNEFFVVEYISKRDTYENYTVDKSGIIVYRIVEGESDTSKMIYVFRPDETSLGGGKGNLTQATLHMGRNTLGKALSINDTFDNETIHYSDGSNSGIIIKVTGETDDSITFDVEFPNVVGDGTKNNPYLISNVDDFLYYMKTAYSKGNYYFKLMNDLDFKDINDYPQIDFSGYFDGNNHVLSNISSIGAGVFDSLGYEGKSVIKNLVIKNINVSPGSGKYLGGLVNSAMNSEITNIKIIGGNVTNKKGLYLQATGGLIGTGTNTVSIRDCYVEIDVSSSSDVGGLIGLNQNMNLNDIYYKGNVEGNTNKGIVIGCQYITDSSYNIPSNVYYETSSKGSVVGGGYYGHDENTLPLDKLDIGIKKMIPISGINIDNRVLTMNVLDTKVINVTLMPSNHTMKNTLYYSSSDESIVSIDDSGKITAKKSGKAKITIKTINNISMTIDINVIGNTITTEADVLRILGITKKDGYVYGFKVGMKVSDIKSKINSIPNVKLKYFNSNISNVATGMTFGILIDNKEHNYTIIIKGDVDGDGKIFATDYVRIRNHIMGKSSLSKVALKAADVNNDNKVFATDYVKIRNYIMGKGNIDQIG